MGYLNLYLPDVLIDIIKNGNEDTYDKAFLHIAIKRCIENNMCSTDEVLYDVFYSNKYKFIGDALSKMNDITATTLKQRLDMDIENSKTAVSNLEIAKNVVAKRRKK